MGFLSVLADILESLTNSAVERHDIQARKINNKRWELRNLEKKYANDPEKLKAIREKSAQLEEYAQKLDDAVSEKNLSNMETGVNKLRDMDRRNN